MLPRRACRRGRAAPGQTAVLQKQKSTRRGDNGDRVAIIQPMDDRDLSWCHCRPNFPFRQPSAKNWWCTRDAKEHYGNTPLRTIAVLALTNRDYVDVSPLSSTCGESD